MGKASKTMRKAQTKGRAVVEPSKKPSENKEKGFVKLETLPEIEAVDIKEEVIEIIDEKEDETEEFEFQFNLTADEYFKIIEDLRGKSKDEVKGKSKKKSCPHKNCKNRFVSAAKLQEHLEHHKTVNCCHLCGKIIEGQQELSKHIRMHSVLEKRKENEKKKPIYRCDLCGRQLKNRTNLQAHMETHDEGRYCECEWCGKKLKSESILKDHIQLHISVKDFICELCGREFSNEQLYIKHGPQHSTNHPFKCTVCSMSFHHQSTLCRHSKIHMTTINCNFCFMTFSFDSLYRRHLLQKHDDVNAIKLPRSIIKINYRNRSKIPSHQKRATISP